MGEPGSVGLITRRSQVQILPPLFREGPDTGPSAYEADSPTFVRVC